ncbi:AMP-binding protein [Methylobacterium gnaphalii]|uniref:Long-chain-fatty-acid--CoA ligase n=1 Tax=Methylobacterium gnaphalii TaxID=1010610 RepID=A0A512JRR9_9HYPH|nr:AMP-binding protein [Methylobacterium gnaphalii]GEP12650.1 long-chain-fatty-acid--CoA ligase [Methylobacterium gnaphalii]GJD71318.1 Long-chain-fatty-acid--CoA ligase [Methylobacterium gnaphalii]GLS48825.1 long-chain-fatty-acid--CoA ligase [Methylobacterium gnaphalii]
MSKAWLAHYDPGVPEYADVARFNSLAQMFEEAVSRFRDRPAFSSMGRELSYGDLDKASARLARHLRNVLNLQHGDRVAIMLPNVLQYPIAFFGVVRAGLVVVNVNPLFTAPELVHQLRDSGAKTVIVLENFCATLEEALRHIVVPNVIVTSVGDELGMAKGLLTNFVVRCIRKLIAPWQIDGYQRWRRVTARRRSIAAPNVVLERGDTALLQYTGGTTGFAKGAILTHGNVLANALILGNWFAAINDGRREKYLVALPLYHAFALICQVVHRFIFGGCGVLIANPRDLDGLVAEMQRHRFRNLAGVPSLFQALARYPGIRKVDFSETAACCSGGAPLTTAVAEAWKAATGLTIIDGYGLTEVAGVAAMNPLGQRSSRSGIGFPVCSTEIEIRREDGSLAAPTEPGEIHIRGPQVMLGYFNQPEETARVLDASGFLATGDIATMSEDGYLTLVERKKDMAIVSGFNVYPSEIDDVLTRHYGILEAAAVSVPDPETGEAIIACVVRRDLNLTEAAVIEHARASLTRYKVPRCVVFLDTLPKTPVGKVLRRVLQEQVGKLAERAGSKSTEAQQ